MPFERRLALKLACTALLVALTAAGARAQALAVRLEQGSIRVSTARTQFLQGKSLDRLRNGASVVFAIQLSLAASPRGRVLASAAGRFAVSFDIWEERFAVIRLAHSRKPASHLTVAEAEDWCLDSLTLADTGISPDAAFWIRLDIRTEEPDEAPAPGEDAGVTLARLVELFSRPQNDGGARLHVEGGPWRLRLLRKGV